VRVQSNIRADKMAETIMRVANDDQLREHARNAYESALAAYGRIQDKGTKAATDKRVTDDIARAATELQDAARRLSASKHRRGRGFVRMVLVGAVIGGAAYAAKRAMESDEDEFEYRP
jgi:hypothetical protein